MDFCGFRGLRVCVFVFNSIAMVFDFFYAWISWISTKRYLLASRHTVHVLLAAFAYRNNSSENALVMHYDNVIRVLLCP